MVRRRKPEISSRTHAFSGGISISFWSENFIMKLTDRIKEAAAAGYILLWLLGVPIPILFIIFLLRGCS
jgi:hypothetical protein